MSFNTRRERILQQGKQRQILTSDRVPLSTESSEGDIRITKTAEGTRLLVKLGSEWLGTPPLTPLTNKANTNEIEHSFITKIKDKNNDEAISIDSSITAHKPLILNGNLDAIDGDFDGTLEADAITVNGTALNTVIAGVTVTNATNATNAVQVTSEGVVESCKMKIFQGTTPAVANTEEITHGITNGSKRIAMINVSIQTDVNPSGTAPAQSFIAPGGTFQDDGLETHEYTTHYDDSKIYIYLETSATGLDANQYVCTVWYTGTDIY